MTAEVFLNIKDIDFLFVKINAEVKTGSVNLQLTIGIKTARGFSRERFDRVIWAAFVFRSFS